MSFRTLPCSTPIVKESDVIGDSIDVQTFVATMLGSDPTHFDHQSQVIGFTPLTNTKIIFNGETHIQLHPMNDPVECSYGQPVAICTQRWGSNYYHFLCENLFKILWVSQVDPTLPIVIYRSSPIDAVIAYFKIPNPIISAGYYTWTNSEKYIKQGWLMSESKCGHPPPETINFIRTMSKLSLLPPKYCIVIFRREQVRSIINFDELMMKLKITYPDEQWIIFDTQPFGETVKLFSQAKLIIGAHGAGLSNIIFAPLGTPVIEMTTKTIGISCFWHLSWILGHQHKFVLCSSDAQRKLNAPVDTICSVVDSIRKR